MGGVLKRWDQAQQVWLPVTGSSSTINYARGGLGTDITPPPNGAHFLIAEPQMGGDSAWGVYTAEDALTMLNGVDRSGDTISGGLTLDTSDGEIRITPTGWRTANRAQLELITKEGGPADFGLTNIINGTPQGWQFSSRGTLNSGSLVLYTHEDFTGWAARAQFFRTGRAELYGDLSVDGHVLSSHFRNPDNLTRLAGGGGTSTQVRINRNDVSDNERFDFFADTSSGGRTLFRMYGGGTERARLTTQDNYAEFRNIASSGTHSLRLNDNGTTFLYSSGTITLDSNVNITGNLSGGGAGLVASGTYTGNGSTSNRTIVVGFTPSLVILSTRGFPSPRYYSFSPAGRVGDSLAVGMYADDAFASTQVEPSQNDGRRPWLTTNGFVVRVTSGGTTCNASNTLYDWVAIG